MECLHAKCGMFMLFSMLMAYCAGAQGDWIIREDSEVWPQ